MLDMMAFVTSQRRMRAQFGPPQSVASSDPAGLTGDALGRWRARLAAALHGAGARRKQQEGAAAAKPRMAVMH